MQESECRKPNQVETRGTRGGKTRLENRGEGRRNYKRLWENTGLSTPGLIAK